MIRPQRNTHYIYFVISPSVLCYDISHFILMKNINHGIRQIVDKPFIFIFTYAIGQLFV